MNHIDFMDIGMMVIELKHAGEMVGFHEGMHAMTCKEAIKDCQKCFSAYKFREYSVRANLLSHRILKQVAPEYIV